MDSRIIQYGDPERYPTLSEEGARMLKFLNEHPQAPIYRNRSGTRLLASDITTLANFEKKLSQQSIEWNATHKPTWLADFVQNTYSDVPYYRTQGQPSCFEHIETITRADLSHDVAMFVPNCVNSERLTQFSTTGTSGNPLSVPSHPRVAAMYLSFHRRALRRRNIELTAGPNQVGVVLVGSQDRCFTYTSVTPQLRESGLAKINLNTNDWHKASDRSAYLDALNAEVYTGDPLSFSELMCLPLKTKPRALISVGMMLSKKLTAQLESHFDAPVLDIYSITEAGPIGVYDNELEGHLLLQPNLYIEILDKNCNPVALGEHGEITLTGGFNFCLPLLRYRTGDYASLSYSAEGPVLTNLAGRKPLRYQASNGSWLNNIEVTHALQHLPIAQFGLHQGRDGALTLRLSPNSMSYADKGIAALQALFGHQAISAKKISTDDKILQYTSDLAGAEIN